MLTRTATLSTIALTLTILTGGAVHAASLM